MHNCIIQRNQVELSGMTRKPRESGKLPQLLAHGKGRKIERTANVLKKGHFEVNSKPITALLPPRFLAKAKAGAALFREVAAAFCRISNRLINS